MANETEIVGVGMVAPAENQPLPTIGATQNVQRDQTAIPGDNQKMTTVVGPSAIPVNHLEKPEKFTGVNFVTWQQKMLFYLTTLNLARYLT
ncbi:hypothetical protein LINGRAHAP2_LOCUS30038, partial [Linum grandiflorum]